jgi:hypothetical protein
MAGEVLIDCVGTINGVNLSVYMSQVEVTGINREDKDVTGFGGSGMKEHASGLNDPGMKFTFHNKFGTGLVEATLWPLALAGTAVVCVVHPHVGAVSIDNPYYTMTGILLGFTPLSGSPGDVTDTEATFVNAASTGVVRTIA